MNKNVTKIKKNYTHDSMSIEAKLPSGATLKFRVGRNGETLSVAFSNDRTILKQQTKTIQLWLSSKGAENNQDRFNRLEAMLIKSKSGAQFIQNISL